MRFDDLATPNLQLYYKRHARYFQYLADCGFMEDDPLYQTFGVNHYHDSPLRMQPFRIRSGTLAIVLRNVIVSNALHDRLQDRTGRRPILSNDCFETKIVFRGIDRLTFSLGLHIRHPRCYQTIIGKTNGLYTVEFEVDDQTKWLRSHGFVAIRFESLEVEDIRPKLRKAVGSRLPNVQELGPVRHGPKYYAKRFAEGKGIQE